MAKKEKTPLTFEELAREKERKEKKAKLFERTFLKAFALFTAFAVVFFAISIAFVPEIFNYEVPFYYTSGSGSSGGSSSGSSGGNGSGSGSGSNTADNGGATDNGGSNDAAPVDGNNGGSNDATPAEDDVLTVFNEAINKVKTEASAITHVSGGTNNNGGLDSSSKMPGIIKMAAGGIINAAMSSNGVKDDGSVIGSADFPVENQSYSSQLTADDVVSATRSGNTITIVIKDDDIGAADSGHCQKAMNVIKASTIMENIPSVAQTIAKEAKTSAKNGKIVATLDDNGHVIAADYTFDWDIEIIGSGLDAIIHLASEDHYTIAY